MIHPRLKHHTELTGKPDLQEVQGMQDEGRNDTTTDSGHQMLQFHGFECVEKRAGFGVGSGMIATHNDKRLGRKKFANSVRGLAVVNEALFRTGS